VGSRSNSAYGLRQSRALIHLALRSSAHTEGDPECGIGGAVRHIAPRARAELLAPAARCPAQPGGCPLPPPCGVGE